jgi:hypothetical protein
MPQVVCLFARVARPAGLCVPSGFVLSKELPTTLEIALLFTFSHWPAIHKTLVVLYLTPHARTKTTVRKSKRPSCDRHPFQPLSAFPCLKLVWTTNHLMRNKVAQLTLSFLPLTGMLCILQKMSSDCAVD